LSYFALTTEGSHFFNYPHLWQEGREEMQMRPIRTVIATLLVVSLSSLAHAWASQQDAPRTAEPMKQEQSKPLKEAPQPKSPAAPETNPPKAEGPQKNKQPKQEQKQQNQPREQHPASKQPGRPAGRSAHIPDDQFKAHFGRPHTFPVKQVITTTTIIPNQTRFVDAGYTFIILDPWPAEWLLTDDCFIDYIDDEYFLFDVFHPGVRIALFVVE
jgi:outer membrane biosynthesis protein TonB